MASTARLQVEVVGDTRSVEAAMARASRATSRFGRSAVGQTGAMQALRRNFALVAAAAGGATGSSIVDTTLALPRRAAAATSRAVTSASWSAADAGAAAGTAAAAAVGDGAGR